MTRDLGLLERLARELRERWGGAWVQQAWQDDRGRTVLRLYRSRPEPRTAFLVLSPLTEAQGFGLLAARPPVPPRPPALASYLRAHVVGGRLEAVELLGADRIVALDVRAPGGSFRLILEATGRRGNLVILDPESFVRAAWKWEPAETHPRRPLAPGCAYAPPPPPVVTRCAADAPGENLDLAAAGLWLEETSLAEAGRGAAEASEARVGRERKRLEVRAAKIRADLARLPDPKELRGRGDALAAALTAVRRGDRGARVPDPASPGVSLLIDLDPSLGPGENLNRLYERARKAERARAALEARLAFTLDELASVREADPADPARRPEDTATGGTPGPFRRFRASNGWAVWVGRNGRENDRLVREARPWDLWLHAREARGAHVVLRLPGRGVRVPEEAVLEAARLAAFYSRASTEAGVDVLVAEAARVHRPKGASPGRVLVAGERVVRVRPAEPGGLPKARPPESRR